jgi:hypothetical protein
MSGVFEQVRIYGCEDPEAIKVLRFLSVTANVGYDNYFVLVLVSHNL